MSFTEIAPPNATPPLSVPQQTSSRAPATTAATPHNKPTAQRTPGMTLLGHTALLTLTAFSVLPVYWMFATALRAPEQALSQNPLPWPPSFENLSYAWNAIPLASMLWNTFWMATVLAIAQLAVAILAAYAFSVWNFPGKRILFMLFIGSWLVPFQVTMIPNYMLISDLGLLNSVWGVVVPNLCSAFAVLMLRQHIEAFPREILDAAHMDGRTSWGTLWHVVTPNLRPALAALSIMLFISAWNEYLWPALVLQKSDALIQVGIRSFLGAEGNNWGAVMAAAAVACVPILLIYACLQRYVIDAFVHSGLK